MNLFLLGLKVTGEAQTEDGITNVIAESLPSNEKKGCNKGAASTAGEPLRGKTAEEPQGRTNAASDGSHEADS